MTQEQIRDVVNASANLASVVVNYYLELKKLGMSHDDAVKLAMAYQASVIGLNNTDK